MLDNPQRTNSSTGSTNANISTSSSPGMATDQPVPLVPPCPAGSNMIFMHGSASNGGQNIGQQVINHAQSGKTGRGSNYHGRYRTRMSDYLKAKFRKTMTGDQRTDSLNMSFKDLVSPLSKGELRKTMTKMKDDFDFEGLFTPWLFKDDGSFQTVFLMAKAKSVGGLQVAVVGENGTSRGIGRHGGLGGSSELDSDASNEH